MNLFRKRRLKFASSPRSYDEMRKEVAATRRRLRKAVAEVKSRAPSPAAIRDSRSISRDVRGFFGNRMRKFTGRHRTAARAASWVIAAGVLGAVAAGVARRVR